jgi:spermidine synthase
MRTQEALADLSADAIPSPRPWWARLLVIIYFFTGLTSIAYEVLWVRMLGIQFGVSIFGVIITVAAFMAGLGGGSLFGAAVGVRLRRPLLFFGALEGLVALYALAMPAIFHKIDTWLGLVAVNAALSQWYALQAVTSFLVLFLPAMAMGIGFSLILRAFSSARVPLAKIYGINTLGGALGALLPLVLLPALGWSDALYCVVMFGVLIAIAVTILAMWFVPAMSPHVETNGGTPTVRPAVKDLFIYAGVGAAALTLEVGWTRLYGMIFLRTEYVLAVILSVFLIGIGLGSLWVRGRSMPSWLKVLPLLVACFVLLGLLGFPYVAGLADRQQDYSSLSSALFWQGMVIMGLTLPVTLLLGAWLPILSNRLEQGGHVSGAWLYGANSVGASCGALIGGFLLIPWLGTTGTIILAAMILFACGIALARSARMAMAAPVLVLLAIPVISLPPVAKLLPATLSNVRDLAVYEDALSITHVVEQDDGQRLLLADLRRMDASSDPTAVVVQQDQVRLPLLLHPAPHKVLLLGLGTGISAAGSLPFPDLSLTAVEVSEGAIHAARKWFAPVNAGIMDKMAVLRDDARRFLRAGTSQYDVIIGDLFHPDLVGRGNLLSVQQFRRARERLAPGGLFVQWLALNQFDVHSLRIVLRSFRRAFPHAVLFMDGFRLALVGPKDAWLGAPGALESVSRMSLAQQRKATGGEGVWTWLGRYWGAIPDDIGPVEDEWRPKIEFLLPRARYSGGVNLAMLLDYLLETRPGVDQARVDLKIDPHQSSQFERSYIATELTVRSWEAALQGDSRGGFESQRLLRLAYEANRNDRWVGFSLADQMMASLPQMAVNGRDRKNLLLAVLAIRPDHVGALKALWRLETENGDAKLANYYRSKVLEFSPLDRDASKSQIH